MARRAGAEGRSTRGEGEGRARRAETHRGYETHIFRRRIKGLVPKHVHEEEGKIAGGEEGRPPGQHRLRAAPRLRLCATTPPVRHRTACYSL